MCKAKYLIIYIIALFTITVTVSSEVDTKLDSTNKSYKVLNNLEISPTIVAKEVTENLITIFKDNISSYRKNEKIMYAQVEKILFDIIAFDSISISIMGKYARKATEKQRKKFTDLLKDNLIEFYSKVFLEFEADKFTIDNVSDTPKHVIDEYNQGKKRLISVTLSILKNNERFSVKYSLIQADNKWKLKNITFNKINIGVQLRNRFSEIYSKEKDIDKTIDSWVVNTKQ